MNSFFHSIKARILAVIFTGAVMIALDGSTLSPILYPLKTYFAVDERLIVWAINIEVLFMLVATPIVAKLSDFFGRRRIYLFCVLTFLAGLVIVVLSNTFGMFLLGRALEGIGATVSVLAIVLIGDHFTENRGTVLGIFGVVIGIVYAAGPLIAGFLINFNWHYVFAVNIPVALVLAFLAFRLLPDDSGPEQRKYIDLKGIITLCAAIASFAVFITEFPGFPLPTWLYAVIVVFIVSLLLFWYFERKNPDSILPLSLLKKRNPLIASFLTFFGYLAGAGTYFISTYAIMAFSLDDSMGAYILLPFTIASLVATIIVGKLLDRTGPKPLMFAGGIFSAMGMFLLGTSGSIPIFVAAIVIIGIGNATIAGNALYYVMLEESDKKERASSQGLLNVLLNAGSLIGGALLGAALDSVTGGLADYRATYLTLAVVYVGLTVLVLLLKQDKRDSMAGVTARSG